VDGWVKLHRKIIVSDIYQMPPLYLRVFLRLLIEANHQDNEIPYREKGQSVVGKKLIKRGERLTSVRDICKWVAWYERGCLKEPNPKTIQNILDWLEENNMIEIYGAKGNRKETLYTIVNYDTYQDKDSDKVTEKKQSLDSQVTEKQQSLETNKNDKNVKNVKNDKKGKEKNTKKETYFPNDEKLNQVFLDFMEMRKKIKAPMTERAITMMINKINKHDNDTAIQMLENSIINNWKDIYPLKGKKSSFDEFQELGKEWLSERTGIYENS